MTNIYLLQLFLQAVSSILSEVDRADGALTHTLTSRNRSLNEI
ncbi:MAG TPA: hypothetical protein V6D50_21755 [Chroococcales cyanobacterium]